MRYAVVCTEEEQALRAREAELERRREALLDEVAGEHMDLSSTLCEIVCAWPSKQFPFWGFGFGVH